MLSSETTELLVADRLVKRYGNQVAVNGVSFSIREGEIFGFLGPNGAGKTTTINMLTGLASIDEGAVALKGFDYTRRVKLAQASMGVVPDESNLYDELDGFTNLTFCASLYGLGKKRREARARELLRLFGLEEAGRKPFKAYSKGMKRKLTIAAGIIHEPTILFLDEPTTGIDVTSARQIRKLLLDLNAGGMTIFLTTHYIEEAERLCHRIAFIVNGRLVRTGTLAEHMRDAQHEAIVQFTTSSGLPSTLADLQREFPGFSASLIGEESIRIQAPESTDLLPFMRFFAARGIRVFEARLIRPSLEEVFIQVTGVEAERMRKEKEGGRR